MRTAVRLLDGLWKDGYRYRKCGVLLVDLVRPEDLPRDLFSAALIGSWPPSMRQTGASDEARRLWFQIKAID